MSADSTSNSETLSTASSEPPRGIERLLLVYWVTFVVAGGYLWLRLLSKVLSPARTDELLRAKHLQNARRIERCIARLQGLFIKVGQLISIMTNFLPPEFRSELAGLQDRVPPRPYSDVEARVSEDFGGARPLDLFAEFASEPVAAASIGQVHRARLKSGEYVAVKVQYPDIDEIVALDLRLLHRIVKVISYFFPYRGLDGVYREIRGMILQELDFRAEAANLERIASHFVGRTDVKFPRVHPEFCSARILTTGWISGVKVSDRQRLQALGVDQAGLARLVVSAYCQQIFTDGVYHADPHPGNLLVERDNEGTVSIVFIDFGAIAEVSPKMRRGIIDLIQAGLTRNTPRLVQAMKDMGFISRGADPAIFDRVIDFLHQRFQEEIALDSFSLKDVKFDPKRALENLADLRRMEVSIRDLADHFHVPKEWILLERTILLLMGLCTELDPTLNPMTVIRPYLEEFVLGKDRDWQALLVDTTKDLASSLVGLPADIKKFLQRAQQGELEVRFRGIDEHARVLYALGHQLLYAVLGISAATFAMVFDGRRQPHAAHVAWWSASGFAVLLGFSLLAGRHLVRRRRR